MASISLTEFHKSFAVRKGSAEAAPWQAIQVDVGGSTICFTRGEAAQLAADLLDAIDSQKVAA